VEIAARRKGVSERPRCSRCGAVLSAYRRPDEPDDLCAACGLRQASEREWKLLDPERLVYAVAGLLLSAAAERPGESVHLQAVLERRYYLTDNVDVHGAVQKLRRRYRWKVEAEAGRPGYRLSDWSYEFRRARKG